MPEGENEVVFPVIFAIRMKNVSRIFLLLSWLLMLSVSSMAQTPTDSSLRETLTRAVQHWQSGKAKDAYLSLDSITGTMLTPENASTKVKAAIWTANYLQAQYKVKSAAPFLDSAMIWAEKYAPGEELARAYDAYSEWHLKSGNPKTALVAKEASWKIRDSLGKAGLQIKVDSLLQVVEQLKTDQQEIIASKNSETGTIHSEAAGLKIWLYVLGGLCTLLLVVVFLMNGNLQRLKNTPPAPAPSAPRVRAEPIPSPKDEVAGSTPETSTEAITPKSEPIRPTPPAPLPKSEIITRLQEVELVLIKAEVLGQHQKGEIKAIHNILNEYMAQLPFIMKTLDDAITRNEADPILNSLEHLKPYLQTFGMSVTIKLISEIEAEAPTEKIAKLLSRVFQVRNHCRRAADEAKAILEKM